MFLGSDFLRFNSKFFPRCKKGEKGERLEDFIVPCEVAMKNRKQSRKLWGVRIWDKEACIFAVALREAANIKVAGFIVTEKAWESGTETFYLEV